MILANLEFQFDWNFADAERDFQRVIASAPNFAEARHQFVYYLAMMSRFDEAIAQQRLAEQLDPVNPSIVVDSSLPYYLARRYNEAVAEARKAAEMFPTFFLPHMALGSALVETGDAARGVAELEQAWKLQPMPLVGSHLGYAYVKAGRVDDARRMLSTLTDESKERYVPAYKIAILHAALGDKDNAFARLEQAYRDRSWWLVWLNVDPMVDSLRSDARLTGLRRRVGLVARNGPSRENDGVERLVGLAPPQRRAHVE